MFMLTVCGHAPQFGAQPHTFMWLCPTIISDLTDLQYHYSGFEMDMRVVHRNTKAHGGVLSKVKKKLYFVCLMSYLERPIWIFVIFGQISQKWCMS